MIQITTGFRLNANMPIDGRMTIPTKANLLALDRNTIYKGIIIYVEEEGLYYEFDGTTYKILLESHFATKEELAAVNVPKGDDGDSAYEVALRNGFVGTEAEWLLSIKGQKGDTGNSGTNGIDGAKGDTGKNIQFVWHGTSLGVRQEGEANYQFVDLASRSLNDAGIRSLCGVTNCGAIDCGRGTTNKGRFDGEMV